MPRRHARAAIAAVLTAALASVGLSCSGSSADKAGGKTRKAATVALTLATHEIVGVNGDADFAAAVQRLSRGSMRIDVSPQWRVGDTEHEKNTINDVRAGKFDLAVVGVRAFDEVGVKSFQALVAPFLVNSEALQRRVLESPLAGPILGGAGRVGLVGIALAPGMVRRPFGVSRAFVRPRDYRGAEIGIRPGGVAAATVRALGATPVTYVEGSVDGLDGAELDIWTIGSNAYDKKGSALTANVALWPRTQAIVMNRNAFDALTPQQRHVLHDAGRAALVPEFVRLHRLTGEGLSAMCDDARTAFVNASSTDLALLRAAVRPVYEQLERDSQTKRFIAAIDMMRGPETTAPALGCPAASPQAQSNAKKLEGRWKWTWTRAELIHVGIAPENAPKLAGPGSVEFRAGRFRTPSGIRGTYRVDGDLIVLVFAAPGPPGTVAGSHYALKWSIYRNLLSFALAPGREPISALLIKPLTRVR